MKKMAFRSFELLFVDFEVIFCFGKQPFLSSPAVKGYVRANNEG